MPAKPAVQVTGAKELRKALQRMGADLGDLTRIHRDVAGIVREAAVQRVPVRSGKLRATIKGKGTKARATVTAGSRPVPYAGPIHFGWPARNIEPQPFLYDALDERKGEVARRYEDLVGDLVKKLDRETPG
jgi:hypothetical protein